MSSFSFREYSAKKIVSLNICIACLLFFIYPFLHAEQAKSDNKAIEEQAELEKEIMSKIGRAPEKRQESKSDTQVSKPKRINKDKGKYVIEVIEEEIKEEPKKEEKKDVELNTAEFYAMKQEYLAELEKSSSILKNKILEIAKKYLEDASEQYEQKKKSGNIKGMAMARDAKSLFNACVESLEKEGKYVPPEKFRKELDELVGKFTAEVNPIVEKLNSEAAEIKESFILKFTEAIRPKIEDLKLDAELSEKMLKEKIEEFFIKEIKAPQAPKVESSAKQTQESPIIASKGMASEWIDVGVWNGDMFGMDIVNIPLNVSEDYTEKQLNPISGEESILSYIVYYPLPPRSDYAFRLVRIKDKFAPDLIEWPSLSNNMTLSVRTKPVAKMPAIHGFVVQASLPPKEMSKVFNKKDFEKRMALKKNVAPANIATEIQKAEKSEESQNTKSVEPGANSVKVSFSTKPQGAVIFVDNFMLNDENGKPYITPCTTPVAQGKHEIKFCKQGYLDKILESFNVDARNNKISAELAMDPKVKSKKISFPARSATAKATGVIVSKGDKIIIDSFGTWSCGEKGDKCGGEGYENNRKFFKYYIDKAKDFRLIDKANYGAIIFKIGQEGQFMSAQPGREIIAPQDGEIIIDINERPDQRRGNSGALDITILVFSQTK